MIQSFHGIAPRIHPSAWVHPAATVIGDVELGAEVSVWPGAVLRGDMNPIRIGARSNIQDGAVVHNTHDLSVTVVGERVTVGHNAVLHGCRVADGCLIGMGSTLLDNAEIGADCLIGAGALVPVGRVIPPESMVLGLPARVVRPITRSEREELDEAWRIYVGHARRWRSED